MESVAKEGMVRGGRVGGEEGGGWRGKGGGLISGV